MTGLVTQLSSFAAKAFAGTNHECDTLRCIIPMHSEPLYRTAKANESRPNAPCTDILYIECMTKAM